MPPLDINTFRVLVTGFGPFPPNHTTENPSWLAVQRLNNTILNTSPHSAANTADRSLQHRADLENRSIHITAIQVPVIYQDVLDIVARIHLRPPTLPCSEGSASIPAPEGGYDFVFHVGVAGRGPLRLEKIGHKFGYSMKDASGKLAPIVHSLKQDLSDADRRLENLSEAEKVRMDNRPVEIVQNAGENTDRPVRGYGIGYETFPEDMRTDVDVEKLVHDLRCSGIEDIYASMDAGHYLCDFIYFGSLAESKRSASPYEQTPRVLFLHCPPVNQPHSTEEVTEAIKRIIVWVCSELHAAEASAQEVVRN